MSCLLAARTAISHHDGREHVTAAEHQFSPTVCIESTVQPLDVPVDGMRAEAQTNRNLLLGIAAQQIPEHLLQLKR